ncbi:MAG: hypothetical protein AAGH19_11425, partial [Pseudomonadota bacterium]
NANLYYMDWEDQQASFGPPLDTTVINAGESRLYGVEFDLRWLAGNAWTFFLAGAYNNTEFTDFDLVDPLLNGNEFPISPEYQFSTGAIAQFDSGWFLSVDASYTDDFFSDTENSPSPANPTIDNRNDDYTVVNAKFGYQADRWSANLFVRNAFDEFYTLRVNRGDPDIPNTVGQATVGAPRVVGLEFMVDY